MGDVRRSGTAAKALPKLMLSIPAERAGFAVTHLSATAAIDLQKADRIALHYILEGEVDLAQPDGTIVRLVSGDFVCLPRGGAHGLAGSKARGRPRRVDWLATLEPGDMPAQQRFGTDTETGAMLLSASIDARHMAADHMMQMLPECVILHAGADRTASFAPPAPCRMALEGVGAVAFACAILQVLLVQAVRSVMLDEEAMPAADLRMARNPRIAEAHRLIERDYREPWTISKLASAVGMSRSSFVATFADVLGESPGARLTRIRLSEARRMLGSEWPVGDVAHHVGYQSQAAFNRAFRRQYGETPTAVRRAMHGTAEQPARR